MAADYSRNISQDIPVSTPNFSLTDNSGMIKAIGGNVMDAYVGYKESEFEDKLEQEVSTVTNAQNTIFEQTNQAAEARGVGEDVAIRSLLNTGNDEQFKQDREKLASSFQSELSRIKQAAEQLPGMRDQMFTRASALLRQYIASTPGLADRYRAIAAKTVGVDGLYTYQLDKLYSQIDSIEKQKKDASAAAAKQAEAERKEQYEYVSKNNPELDPTSIFRMLDDPVMGPQIAAQSRNNAKVKVLQEQTEQAYKALEQGSKVNASQASNLVMAGFTAGAFDVVNSLTQQSFKNRPELMKYVDNPNMAPAEFFAALSEGSIVAKQQLDLQYQTALSRAEQVITQNNILGSDADGIRNRLKTQYENASKMLDSSGGTLALLKQLQTTSKLRVDEQAARIASMTDLANQFGFSGQVLQDAQSNPKDWFERNVKTNPSLASFGRAYMEELSRNPFVGEAMRRYMTNPLPEAGVADSDKGAKVAANSVSKVAAQDFLSNVTKDPTSSITPQQFVQHAGSLTKVAIEGFDDGMEVALRALSPAGIITQAGKKAGPQGMEELKNLVTQQVDFTLMNSSDTSRTGMLKKHLEGQASSLKMVPQLVTGPTGALRVQYLYGDQAAENKGKVAPYTDNRASRQAELIDNTLRLKSMVTGEDLNTLRQEYIKFFNAPPEQQSSVDRQGALLKTALDTGKKLPEGQTMASTPEEKDVLAILSRELATAKAALQRVPAGSAAAERLQSDISALEAELKRVN